MITDEEKLLLDELKLGHEIKEIALKYGLEESKIKEILKNMVTRLGAKNLEHALYIALKDGFVK